MEWARRRSLDRVGRLAIVLGGHWLLVEVLFGGWLAEPRRTVDSPESLIWIPIAPPVPREQPERKERIARRPRTQAAQTFHTELPAVVTEPPAVVAAVPLQPSEPIAVSRPDWNLAAQAVAEAMAPGLINELEEKCATAKRLAQALPPGCRKDSPVKAWHTEPKRAGFVGIFPYVRIGRCIIGLGVWGCAIGKPVADGTLFDDMRNPDRPLSSVPDLPAEAFPKAPVPQVFK